jgi:hypothetical protein
LFAATIALSLSASSYAQLERVGGPFTVDANTVMLLHLDSSFVNESSMTADAIPETNTLNGYMFFEHTGVDSLADMGHYLYMQNDSRSDSTYIHVPDDDDLDLQGDWTIEGWMQVITYGSDGSDWRAAPRLLMKPGVDVFWQPNYWVEFSGVSRAMEAGFYTDVSGERSNWPGIRSEENVFIPGRWTNMTFIRDSTRQLLALLIFDDERQLVWNNQWSLAEKGYEGALPMTNASDFYSGWAGPGSAESWMDGFIDELRISNVVRNYPVPPVIASATRLGNQSSEDTGYPVEAEIFPWNAGSTIDVAVIKYSVDEGDTWLEATMTDQGGDMFLGEIPQQAPGSTVWYYVYAEDNYGQSVKKPKGQEGDDFVGEWYEFAITAPNSNTLTLNFEGDLTDGSAFAHEPTAVDGPFFSDDAKEGSQSILFPADDPADSTLYDSAYVYIDSPFLTSEDFAVDLWFKYEADTLLPYIRLICRTNNTDAAFHVDHNYYIRTEENWQLSADYQVGPQAAGTKTKDNVTLMMHNIQTTDGGDLIEHPPFQRGEWYHALFERDSTKAVFELRDANDTPIYRKADTDSVYLNPPFYPANGPLLLGWARNSWDNLPRRFVGKMDAIRVYNYAAFDLSTDSLWAVPGVNKVGKVYDQPLTFDLDQNYPNPFNPTTTIKYSIPEATNVTLEVYDVMGAKVRTLVSGNKEAGKYEATWNATNDAGVKLASGAYFYRLQAGNKIKTMKMMLLK